MTDLEISKALALAIGWTMANVLPDRMQPNLQQCWVWTGGNWRLFDYRDWNVIGQIAERYNCFPDKDMYGIWIGGKYPYVQADTPQKAIALAVIGSKK